MARDSHHPVTLTVLPDEKRNNPETAIMRKKHHSNEIVGDPYHNQNEVSNQKGVPIQFYAVIFPNHLESRLIIPMFFVLAVRRRRVCQKVFASPRHLR
jgi:hypothetical protein